MKEKMKSECWMSCLVLFRVQQDLQMGGICAHGSHTGGKFSAKSFFEQMTNRELSFEGFTYED